jgi:AmmeMemoRadiSam system protein B
MSTRRCAVRGTFYPYERTDVEKYIKDFNKSFSIENEIFDIKAAIVPHAGYVYSGFTANLAYNLSTNHNLRKNIKRVIVIGPSHRVYLEGSSIALYDFYETPLGSMQIDLDYSNELMKKYNFLNFFENVHQEHSTETQIPFIKNYFKDTKIIEIVYGKQDFEELSLLIDELFEDKSNFIVISSDLSHFYTLEEAKKLDNKCIKAIEDMDLDQFDSGCEACGMIGIKALIKSSLKKGFKTKILHYCTSYDASNDSSRVVGYTSALVVKE